MRQDAIRRSFVLLTGAVLVLGAWLAQPAPAEAGELSVSLGVGFVVGGAQFRVAYATGGYLPYYYRVDRPLHHRGYVCSDHCYLRRGHVYHAPFCPLVAFHFSHHRYVGPYHHRHPAWYNGLYRTRGHHRGAFYGPHRRGHRGWAHHHHRIDSSRHHRGVSRHLKHSHRGDRGRAYEGRRSGGRNRHDVDDRRRHDRSERSRHSRGPGSARRTRPS